jgi:hypothetical protein
MGILQFEAKWEGNEMERATTQTHKSKTGRFSTVSCCGFQYCCDSPGLVSPATSCMLHGAGREGRRDFDMFSISGRSVWGGRRAGDQGATGGVQHV